MSSPQLIDLDRVKQMANAVVESVKQLKLSIETSSTRLNATMLREQTLGTITPEFHPFVQADFSKANVGVILALYKYRHPHDGSDPTVIIANEKNRVCAAVVRTYYDKSLKKDRIVTTIKGPICTSEFKALEGLYKISRGAVDRAIHLSKNENGFDDWDDLDLWL